MIFIGYFIGYIYLHFTCYSTSKFPVVLHNLSVSIYYETIFNVVNVYVSLKVLDAGTQSHGQLPGAYPLLHGLCAYCWDWTQLKMGLP